MSSPLEQCQEPTARSGSFFERVRESCAAGKTLSWREDEGPFAKRFCRAMEGLSSKKTMPLDWALLVRQLLRREDERQWGTRSPSEIVRAFESPTLPPVAALTVPTEGRGWPDVRTWNQVGVHAVQADKGVRLQAHVWQPSWLDGCPARAAEAELPRRAFATTAGEPVLKLCGYPSYSNSGQREAIRAVLTTPPGATLLVNLPTGAGKSLCGHLPALTSLPRAGETSLSIIVVPTTALCIDQEQVLRPRLGQSCAYYTGRPREELESIRSRIARGEQRAVVTSPEALLASLRPVIYAAARKGCLKWLVIDEAHIVSSWGDEFRPAFQMLPGMRRDLLREAGRCGRPPFNTLLLSATVTASVLKTLHDLFGDPGPFSQLSAVQLRPEPSYWMSKCDSLSTKWDRVEESLLHLPRPIILYTTTRKDAGEWLERLTRLGFARVRMVTGETDDTEREKIIRAWRSAEIDVIVATSAFGLGMDQADVRSVVHATIPESIDRFYQEVGRGGRDGLASISLLVYTQTDIKIARKLGEDKLITIQKGLARWQAMFHSRKELDYERLQVPIDAAPQVGMSSRQNEQWNVRTLALMARAGMLRVDAVPPPDLPPHDASGDITPVDLDKYECAWREDSKRRVVTPLIGGHLDLDLWAQRIEPWRLAEYEATRRDFQTMTRSLKQTRCLAEVLAEVYAIGRHTSAPPAGVAETPVALACGGCAWCRSQAYHRATEPMPRSRPPWAATGTVGSGLGSLLDRGRLLMLYPPSSRRWREDLERVVAWIVGQGIRAAVSSKEDRNELSRIVTRTSGSTVLLFDIEELGAGSQLLGTVADMIPSVVVHPPGTLLLSGGLYGIVQPRTSGHNAPRIVLVPSNTPSPDRWNVPLADRPPMAYRYTGEVIANFGL